MHINALARVPTQTSLNILFFILYSYEVNSYGEEHNKQSHVNVAFYQRQYYTLQKHANAQIGKNTSDIETHLFDVHRSNITVAILELHQKRQPVGRRPFIHMKCYILPRILAWCPAK